MLGMMSRVVVSRLSQDAPRISNCLDRHHVEAGDTQQPRDKYTASSLASACPSTYLTICFYPLRPFKLSRLWTWL